MAKYKVTYKVTDRNRTYILPEVNWNPNVDFDVHGIPFDKPYSFWRGDLEGDYEEGTLIRLPMILTEGVVWNYWCKNDNFGHSFNVNYTNSNGGFVNTHHYIRGTLEGWANAFIMPKNDVTIHFLIFNPFVYDYYPTVNLSALSVLFFDIEKVVTFHGANILETSGVLDENTLGENFNWSRFGSYSEGMGTLEHGNISYFAYLDSYDSSWYGINPSNGYENLFFHCVELYINYNYPTGKYAPDEHRRSYLKWYQYMPSVLKNLNQLKAETNDDISVGWINAFTGKPCNSIMDFYPLPCAAVRPLWASDAKSQTSRCNHHLILM